LRICSTGVTPDSCACRILARPRQPCHAPLGLRHATARPRKGRAWPRRRTLRTPCSRAPRDCAAGAALHECVDGAWAEVGACTPDLIVIDGPWQLELAGALIDGCPSLAPPALEIEAEHPEGTQQLTLTADGATFDEVSLLVAFDVAVELVVTGTFTAGWYAP
jgi:hypothetical protein